MGITRVIHIFDLVSKAVSLTHLKFSGGMPWVSLYQVCLNGHAPMIVWYLMFFCNFFCITLKNLLWNCFANCIGRLLEAPRHLFNRWGCFFSIFLFYSIFLRLLFWTSSTKPSLRFCWNLVAMFLVEGTDKLVHKVALLLIQDLYILCKWSCSIASKADQA